MTKEDVRILSVAKLELEKDFRVLDIGAGTGSVSIQMAKICNEGEVLAIEKDKEALEVIHKNKERFQCENLKIVDGEAENVYNSIDGSFDRIFIGGSGGNIDEIINLYNLKLKDKGKMVLNFITIDNLYKAIKSLRNLNYEVDCTQISISKAKGKSMMMMANNPVFIVCCSKEE